MIYQPRQLRQVWQLELREIRQFAVHELKVVDRLGEF
jgi:hypothetical protein